MPGSFAADGLMARIGLERELAPSGRIARICSERSPRSTPAITSAALDLLLEALPSADGATDDIRRVVVGVLDELGVEHPLARDARAGASPPRSTDAAAAQA